MTRVMLYVLAPLSLFLLASLANAQSHRKIVSGRVVKDDGRHLTVSDGTTSVDVTDDDKTLVKIGGEPGEFDEIAKGDRVTILLDVERGTAITVTVAGAANAKSKPAKGRTTTRKAPASAPAPRPGRKRYYPTGVSEEAEINDQRLRLLDPEFNEIETTHDKARGMTSHHTPLVLVERGAASPETLTVSAVAYVPHDPNRPPSLSLIFVSVVDDRPRYTKDRSLKVTFADSEAPLTFKETDYEMPEVTKEATTPTEGLRFELTPEQFKAVFFSDSASFRLGERPFFLTKREREFLGLVYDEMLKTLGKQATESDIEVAKPRESPPKKRSQAETED